MSTNAELRALEAAATPAPWEHNRAQLIQGDGTSVKRPGFGIDVICWMQGSNQPKWHEDADLIAAMRNRIRELLDDSERLAKLRAEFYVAHQPWCRGLNLDEPCTCGLRELLAE